MAETTNDELKMTAQEWKASGKYKVMTIYYRIALAQKLKNNGYIDISMVINYNRALNGLQRLTQGLTREDFDALNKAYAGESFNHSDQRELFKELIGEEITIDEYVNRHRDEKHSKKEDADGK